VVIFPSLGVGTEGKLPHLSGINANHVREISENVPSVPDFPDFPIFRLHALGAFAELNKYDLRLQRCVGLTFVSEGNETWCDVQWCRLDYPWEENAKFEEALKENYPFRPVKTTVVERYGLLSTEE